MAPGVPRPSPGERPPRSATSCLLGVPDDALESLVAELAAARDGGSPAPG